MVEFIKVGNLYDAWRMASTTVINQGQEVRDERGQLTKEVLDLVVQINNPLLMGRPHAYWYGEKLKMYAEQMMNPDQQGFVYTYGNRLRGHFYTETTNELGFPTKFEHVDQVKNVAQRLIEDNNTRRGTMVTFNPVIDSVNDEIPCIIAIDFKIRRSVLHTSAFWRSNDIWGAYYPNVYGLTQMAKKVADKVGIDVGPLTTHGVSAHIYEYDWQPAQKLADKSTKSYR